MRSKIAAARWYRASASPLTQGDGVRAPRPSCVAGAAAGLHALRRKGKRLEAPYTRKRWRGVARTSVSLWLVVRAPALTPVLTVRLGAGPLSRTSVSLC